MGADFPAPPPTTTPRTPTPRHTGPHSGPGMQGVQLWPVQSHAGQTPSSRGRDSASFPGEGIYCHPHSRGGPPCLALAFDPRAIMKHETTVQRSPAAATTSRGSWGSPGLAARPRGASVCTDPGEGRGGKAPLTPTLPECNTTAAGFGSAGAGRRKGRRRPGRRAARWRSVCVCVCAHAHARAPGKGDEYMGEAG